MLYRYRLLQGDITQPGFQLKHGAGDAVTPGVTERYREIYQVMELRGEFWLGDRISMLASVPLVNNYQSINGYTSADLYGMSDPLVLGRYLLVNTKCTSEEERTVHRVMVGGGVKFPMGQHNLTYEGAAVDHDLQPGTGSWDFLGSAEYMIRRGAWGASTNLIGRYNTANAYDYALGSGLSNTTEVFYRLDGDPVSWVPSVGIYNEYLFQDTENDAPVQGTGGNTFFAHIGSRLWYRNWVLTLNYQYALSNTMGALMVPTRDRFLFGVAYNLFKN